MANASLNIPITGDASAFLSEVERASSRLKELQKEFNDAFTTKGKKLKLEVDASLVEGSIADLKSKIKELEASRDNLPKFDIANFEAANRQIKEYTDEIKRLKGIGIKIDVQQPPPGSIAALKKELAELITKRELIQPFRIEHLTDVRNRIIGIKDEIKRIENIGVEVKVEPINPILENSIAGLEKQLNDLRVAAKNIDLLDEREIARTNDEIKVLEGRIDRFKNLSIDPSGKLTQSSAKARQAITSLSLVAQDLPFGFIAIQNNLPAVLQTFSELSTQSKGSGGALKELGKVLVGPAGVFLAFSAVTAAVTFAVKEYGSLGNAVDALFGKLSKFNDIYMRTAKSLKEYNENLRTNEEIIGGAVGSQQGLISKMSALSEVVLDVTESEDTRKKALQGLQEIDKERFKNFDIETGKYKEVEGAVDAATRAILAKATADAFAQQVGAAAVQFEQQKTATGAALKDLQEFEKEFPGARKLLNEYIKLSEKAAEPAAPSDIVSRLIGKESELLRQQSLLKPLGDEWERLNQLVKIYSKNASKLGTLKPPEGDGGKPKTFAPTIDAQDLDEAFNLDKIISNLNKYGNALIDVENTEKERKNALRELLEINPKYFAGFDLNKSRVEELKASIESYIRTLLVEKKAREDAAAASKINADLRKTEEKGIEKLGDKYNIFNGQVSSIPDTIEKAIKISFDFEGRNPFEQLADNTAGLQIQQAIDGYISKFKDLGEVYNETFPEIAKKNKEIADSINSYLTQPLTDVFDILLKEGEKSWKDFGDTVIQTLKRIAVQLIATAIAKTIANILAPGLGSITTAALGDYVNGNDWVDLFPGGPKSQANFGRIRGNQGVSMSGQVNMVLRGNDLVGAMNRTNSTISRVG